MVVSYANFVASKLDGEIMNISFPGASNYAIAKQVEYAVTLNPNLIIFNTTTHSRIDLKKINTSNFIEGHPSIKDFVYGHFKNRYVNDTNASVYSSSFNVFLSGIAPVDDNKLLEEFILSYDTYINHEMRQDQNRFLVMGILNLLNNSKIPYICIDIGNIFPKDYSNNVISLSQTELTSRFPIKTDKDHFNQDGHSFISEKICQWLLDNNISTQST
jgi:hypothetical protein